MSLHDDVQLALQLLREPLSFDSKPTEKEARAAARRVLKSVAKDLLASWDYSSPTTLGILSFLRHLANAIDPGSVPEMSRREYTRKIKFEYASQGAKVRSLRKHRDIAREVYLLNKIGKKGTSLVAKKLGMDSSEISRICTMPDIKSWTAYWLTGLTAPEAAELLERIAQKEMSKP